MKQFQKMLKQAEKMQEHLNEQLAELTVTGSSGGGAVAVTMNGKKELVKVTISPDAVDPEDVELLQDLVLAAVNEASRQVDAAVSSQVGDMTGGLLGGL